MTVLESASSNQHLPVSAGTHTGLHAPEDSGLSGIESVPTTAAPAERIRVGSFRDMAQCFGRACAGSAGWLGLFSPPIVGAIVGLIVGGPVGLGVGITVGLLATATILLLSLALCGENAVNRCLGGS